MLCLISSFFLSEPYLTGSLCGETILFLFWIYLTFVIFVLDLFTPIYSMCTWCLFFYYQWIFITYQKKKKTHNSVLSFWKHPFVVSCFHHSNSIFWVLSDGNKCWKPSKTHKFLWDPRVLRTQLWKLSDMIQKPTHPNRLLISHNRMHYNSLNRRLRTQLLKSYLDEWVFGSYHSFFITEFSKHVGPTKKIMFDLVSTLVFITQNSNKFELEWWKQETTNGCFQKLRTKLWVLKTEF